MYAFMQVSSNGFQMNKPENEPIKKHSLSNASKTFIPITETGVCKGNLYMLEKSFGQAKKPSLVDIKNTLRCSLYEMALSLSCQ